MLPSLQVAAMHTDTEHTSRVLKICEDVMVTVFFTPIKSFTDEDQSVILNTLYNGVNQYKTNTIDFSGKMI